MSSLGGGEAHGGTGGHPGDAPGAGRQAAGIDLGRGVFLDPAQLTWRFSASGGPGGQHVNTSNTKAEATLDIGGATGMPEWARRRLVARLGTAIVVTASDTRSQARNRDLAIERLARRLRAGLEPPPEPRRPTRPTQASRRRRLEAKRRRSQLKAERRRDTDD